MSDKDFVFDETAPLTGDTDYLEIDELTDTLPQVGDETASLEPFDETDTLPQVGDETASLEPFDETDTLPQVGDETAAFGPAETPFEGDAADVDETAEIGDASDADFFSDDDFWSDDELYSDTAPIPGLRDYDADETEDAEGEGRSAGSAAAVMAGAAAMAAAYAGKDETADDAAGKGGLSKALSMLYDDDEPADKPDQKKKKEKEDEDKGPSAFSIFAGKAGNILSYVIPAVLILVILVSGFLFLRDLLEYKKADDTYKELDSYITELEDAAVAENAVSEATGAVKVADEEKGYPNFKINYEYLKNINSDFVGVLYIPALGVRYPVAASHNNNEYLSTTFDGKQNSSGSIFLDMNASPDFTDSNSIIFGHNMKNGSMFGSLRKFLEDSELCDTDPYIYIYTEHKILKYRIFAYYTTPVNGSVYNGFQNAAGYDNYVARALAASAYSTDEEFDFSSYPPLLLLSTCYGGNHVYNLVVQGVLAETFIQTAP